MLKQNKNNKVISTLKTLLKHFTRKTLKLQKQPSHQSSTSNKISPKNKAKILTNIQTAVIEEMDEENIKLPKTTVSTFLRK